VHVEGRKQNNNGNLNVRALLFNFVTQEYVALPGILALSTTDLVKTYDLPGGSTPTDFVEPGTDKVQVLLQTIQTSGLPNVRTQLDQVLVNFD